MKVAIYCGTYTRNQDGATRTIYELTRSLRKEKIETGIWAYGYTEQSHRHLSLFKVPSVPFFLYPDYRISIPFPQVEKQLDEFSPDLIHSTVPDLLGIKFRQYARKRGIPAVSSFHTNFVSYLKSYRLDKFEGPAWKYLQWLYNGTDSVLVPTREIARVLDLRGIQNVSLWSRGIHLDQFNPRFRSRNLRNSWNAEGRTVILYAGRFVWYKDLETFIQVYQDFSHRNLLGRVRFVLAGDGPIRKTLQARLPEAIFPGYLSGRDLSQVYASSDLFLFPSTTETFGNVIQEGLASGIPALVSDQGGCQEIVASSGAGMVCPAGDVSSFSRACQILVEDRALRERLRAHGQSWVKHRNWDRMNAAVIETYRSLTGNSPDTPSPRKTQPMGPLWNTSPADSL